MKKPLRWKRRKMERMGAAEGYELCQAGKTLAVAQRMPDGKWFCYSLSDFVYFNTASLPTSFEDAKKFAEDKIRTALSQGN